MSLLLRTLPFAFRRPRVLIVGFGDVGQRIVKLQANRSPQTAAHTPASHQNSRPTPRGVRWQALCRTPNQHAHWRQLGVRLLTGNLDDAATLQRLAGVFDAVIHLAPPPLEGSTDPRTRRLAQALAKRSTPKRMVYVSTTGVYGDLAGGNAFEYIATNPATSRAKRRVDAETQLRHVARQHSIRLSILRAPGIYALDRDGGTPRQRLESGLPVPTPADDVFTNHIHADDLARACLAALWRGKRLRIINTSDDSRLTMGDYMRYAAQVFNLPAPPALPRDELAKVLLDSQMSFLRESRRVPNQRLKQELRMKLRYPTVREGLSG